MRRLTVAGVRVGAVLLLFWLVLQGPDYLLVTVLDADLWGPVGVASGVVTLPLLWRRGVGLLPAWTMPAVAGGGAGDGDDDVSLPLASLYHLLGSVGVAWLWTQPTLVVVGRVHELRGFAPVDGVPIDVVSVAAGLLVSEAALFALLLVAFVATAPFGTALTLDGIDAADVAPGVVGIGGYLGAGYLVCVLWVALEASVGG